MKNVDHMESSFIVKILKIGDGFSLYIFISEMLSFFLLL